MKLPRLLALAAFLPVSLFAEQFNVLVFSQTDGWHHDSIPNGVEAIRDLAALHHFSMFWTEDAGRVMNDKALEQFDVIVFLNTTGDILNEDQQAAVERFVQSGKGFVGLHSASDTEYGWEWYTKMVGHMFHIHPAIQTAVMKVEEPNFPGMDRFAPRFLFTEEWYQFDAPRSDELHYLLSVDEKTYNPMTDWGSKKGEGMGDFHPVSWYQEYDGGRAFYTALGHMPATYKDAHFRHHIFGGIYWAATGHTFDAE